MESITSGNILKRLRQFGKEKNAEHRKSLLMAEKTNLLKWFSMGARNILNGNVYLTKPTLKFVQKHIAAIRKLMNPTTQDETKMDIILKRGGQGFLGSVIIRALLRRQDREVDKDKFYTMKMSGEKVVGPNKRKNKRRNKKQSKKTKTKSSSKSSKSSARTNSMTQFRHAARTAGIPSPIARRTRSHNKPTATESFLDQLTNRGNFLNNPERGRLSLAGAQGLVNANRSLGRPDYYGNPFRLRTGGPLLKTTKRKQTGDGWLGRLKSINSIKPWHYQL